MEPAKSASVDPRGTALAIGPWTGLILCLISGAIVFGVIQAVHPVFQVPEEFHAAMGARPEVWEANRRASNQVDRQHAMLYVGGLGLLVGLVLGLREGTLRRSWLPPLLAAPLGGLGGALGGFLGCLIYEHVHVGVGQAELTHTITAQLLLGVPLGLGVGLGLGLATRTVRGAAMSALGGAAAGILAAVLYPVVVSILLPEASTDALLPHERSNQLFWLALLSGLIGLCIPIAARKRRRHESAAKLPDGSAA
jgi:hypothetical protein